MPHRQVTILNVLEVPPPELAEWTACDLLSLRMPEPGPNCTVDIHADILPKLAIIANRIMLASEVYVILTGAHASWAVAKRNKLHPDADNNITTLNDNIEIIHTAIRALQQMYEASSRLMTGLNSTERINR